MPGPRLQILTESTRRRGFFLPTVPGVPTTPSLVIPRRQTSPQNSNFFFAGDSVEITTPGFNLPPQAFTVMFDGIVSFPNIPYQQFPNGGPGPIAEPNPGRITPTRSVSMRLLVYAVLTQVYTAFNPHFSVTPLVTNQHAMAVPSKNLHPGQTYKGFQASLKVNAYNPSASVTVMNATVSLTVFGHLVGGLPTDG